jgi:NADPH-dependent curcumin reductase CurA
VTPHGPNNLFDLITKEISVQGFMTHFRHDRYEEAREQLSQWLRDGLIQSPEYRLEGIESVGKAFADLFAGENFGKTIVAV